MNARAKVDQIPIVDPLVCFEFRCWARAFLFAEGLLELHEAVDVLQADAERSGIVDAIGQDEIQRIICAPFAACRGFADA